MAIGYLKRGDTQPVILVTLLKPDGTVYNPTGSTALKLHVQLQDGTFTRNLTIIGLGDTSPNVQYACVANDWATPGTAPYLANGCWRMEYEIQPASGERITLPNNAHDWLMVTADLGQG